MNRKEAAPISVKHFNIRDPKLWALIGIVLLTLYVFATQWSSSPSAPKASGPKQSSGSDTLAQAEGGSRPVRSRISTAKLDPLKSSDPSLMPQLEVVPKSFDQEKRNLFSFFVPVVIPPPKPDPVCGDGICNGQETYETCPAECQPPPPPPVCGDKKCEGNESFANCSSDCEPPPPPEISLKYIGYLNDSGGAVAFLTDGKEVFMGRVNDIIANRYRVVRITEDGIELGYVNLKSGQSRRIPFQGSNKS